MNIEQLKNWYLNEPTSDTNNQKTFWLEAEKTIRGTTKLSTPYNLSDVKVEDFTVLENTDLYINDFDMIPLVYTDENLPQEFDGGRNFNNNLPTFSGGHTGRAEAVFLNGEWWTKCSTLDKAYPLKLIFRFHASQGRDIEFDKTTEPSQTVKEGWRFNGI